MQGNCQRNLKPVNRVKPLYPTAEARGFYGLLYKFADVGKDSAEIPETT